MFMRVAVPEFGAFSMAAARVGLACLIMLVIVTAFRQTLALGRRWKTYLAVGAVNTAIPFIAYSFARAAHPGWLQRDCQLDDPGVERADRVALVQAAPRCAEVAGIAFAFAGVLVLVGLQPVALTPLAVVGMLAAALAASMYATAGFLIKHYLTDDGPDAEVSQVGVGHRDGARRHRGCCFPASRWRRQRCRRSRPGVPCWRCRCSAPSLATCCSFI